MISDRILRHHTGTENELYNQMGGFWAAIICVINETGEWPWVHEILAIREEGQIAFTTELLDKEPWDEAWRQGEKRISVRDLPTRIPPGSPLESILHRLRRQACAQIAEEEPSTAEDIAHIEQQREPEMESESESESES
jgi:hypothetical protein